MKRPILKLTDKQERWLNEHGGRYWHNVAKDRNGMYVEMADPRVGVERVYLPM
ncbi:MAG: hypothetical protein NUV49_03590 [Patescibacteria group bacterium]|nr:hypothetical protein [Patescibacteria group bacterium]